MGKSIWLAILLGGIGCGFGPVGPGPDGGADATVGDDGPSGTVTVEETRPATDATGVDPDVQIWVRFSSRIRPEAINEETFIVTGPLGVAPGGYLVEGDEVTFIPAAPQHLLGNYQVLLTTDIVGYEEGPMADPYEWDYAIRDGGWTDREDLATDVGEFVDLARNRRGDMVLAFTTISAPASVKAVRFDSGSRSFSLPELLEQSATSFAGARAAINEDRDVVVAWSAASDPNTRGWARRSGGAWQGATIEPGTAGSPGLTAGGTAIMATTSGADILFQTLGPRTTSWSAPATALAGADLLGVLHSAERAEIIAYDHTAQQLVARAYVEGDTLATAQPLSDPGIVAGSVHLQYLPGADLAVSWAQDDAHVWYAQLDGDSAAWSPPVTLADGFLGSALCANGAGARIAAFLDINGTMHAVHAGPGQDFSPPQSLGSPDGMQYARCAIDDLGNGVVLWAAAGDKSYQSRVVDGSFTPAALLGDGPTMFAAVAEPGTGRVRALFYTGEKLTTRAFE